MRREDTTSRGRAWRLLLALACLAVAAPVSAAPQRASLAPAAIAACPSFGYVRGAGDACRASDGLLRVRTADGSILTSHGPDAYRATGSTSSAPARAPKCATGAANDYYVVPIYARAIDDADDFSTRAATIRTVVQQADGLVDASAAAAGSTADLKVLCTNNVIAVQNVTLPTPKANTDFTTVVDDLRRAGYNNPRLKYWVYVDERNACGCAGMANMATDDRLRVENANNGNSANPMFAVVFGYLTTSTMLHELAHTMGAVQSSAPHTTGAGHCIDGRDVMCYRDGGPRSGSYSTSRCASEVFDCGRDDYFNPQPASGSYLATHWNLGSRLNRYLSFDPGGAPVMNMLACPGKAGVYRWYSCYVRAADDSTGVAYVVNWGDGSALQRVPRTGFVPPNTYLEAKHVYRAAKLYRVVAYAVDNGKPVRTSRALQLYIRALVDKTAPALTVMDPAKGVLYKGCGAKGVYLPDRPAIAQRACLSTRTSDAGTGVAGIWIYVGGRYAGWTRSPRVEFGVKGPATNVPVRLEVRDYAGNVRSVTFIVDILA